jgi:hypothetical protein
MMPVPSSVTVMELPARTVELIVVHRDDFLPRSRAPAIRTDQLMSPISDLAYCVDVCLILASFGTTK